MNEKTKQFGYKLLSALEQCDLDFNDLHSSKCFYVSNVFPDVLVAEYSPRINKQKIPGKPTCTFLTNSAENKKILKVFWGIIPVPAMLFLS